MVDDRDARRITHLERELLSQGRVDRAALTRAGDEPRTLLLTGDGFRADRDETNACPAREHPEATDTPCCHGRDRKRGDALLVGCRRVQRYCALRGHHGE